jgi:hypothetical protein
MRLIMSVCLCMMTTSCTTLLKSNARVVKKQNGKGGVIAIEQGFDNGANAREEARQAMAQNCNGQYDITEEGEVVVGKVSSQRKEEKTSWGVKGEETVSDESDKKEWRITYACK